MLKREVSIITYGEINIGFLCKEEIIPAAETAYHAPHSCKASFAQKPPF